MLVMVVAVCSLYGDLLGRGFGVELLGGLGRVVRGFGVELLGGLGRVVRDKILGGVFRQGSDREGTS